MEKGGNKFGVRCLIFGPAAKKTKNVYLGCIEAGGTRLYTLTNACNRVQTTKLLILSSYQQAY